MPTTHTISNDEITLTMCGEMLAGEPDVNSTEAVRLASGPDSAIWDDTDYPADALPCVACLNAAR